MVPQTNPQAFDCVVYRSRCLHTQKDKTKNKVLLLLRKQGYFYAKFHESEPGETWLGRGRSVGNVCHLSSDALPLSGTYQGDLRILKSLSSWSNLPPLPLWLWQPWHKTHLLPFSSALHFSLNFQCETTFLIWLLICFAFSKVTFCIVL